MVQRRLECGDVVTSQLWGAEEEEAVAECESGLDQGEPGRFVTGSADVEPTLALKRGGRLARGRAEEAGLVAGGGESSGAEATL